MDNSFDHEDESPPFDMADFDVGDDIEGDPLTDNYRAALSWLKLGYNVLPMRISPGKKYPAVKWREYQVRRVSEDDLRSWFPNFGVGVGFVTGEISGVVVIDTDGEEGEEVLRQYERLHGALPSTRTVRSGSGRGLHRHYKHPGYKVKTTQNTDIQVDIRGDGGVCVLPPSLHYSGGKYELVDDAAPAKLPPQLLEFIEKQGRQVGDQDQGSKADEDQLGDLKPILGQMPDHLLASALEPNTEGIQSLDREPSNRDSHSRLPAIEDMRAALRYLASRHAFKQRNGKQKDKEGRITGLGWIEAGMALKPAYGDEEGFDLWSETHTDDRARDRAPEDWASFASEEKPGNIKIGTIIKAAKDAGFTFSILPTPPSTSLKTVEEILSSGDSGDVLNGRILAQMFRDRLLYVHETGEWLLFDPSSGWITAPPGEADRAAKEVLRVLREGAAEAYKNKGGDDPQVKRRMKHVERTSDIRHQRAMIEAAKSEYGMTVRLSEFDDDPMLLGVDNGVLDLRNRKLLPVKPDVLVSKRCDAEYDPNARSPRFEKFLRAVQPDQEVRKFLQRVMGYCLTGQTSEQLFFFFHGSGANGKSVFIELLSSILGDYARKIATDMLMRHQRNPAGPSPDIVGLKGQRLVFANETEEGRRLDEARVKDFTGGDTLTGRVPYGKADIMFEPSHKLFILGNHKPEIADMSEGMWRRLCLVPFDVIIPEAKRDKKLLEKLKQEKAGILNWMLEGLEDWMKNGMQVPKKVKNASSAYREEQDIIGEWVADCCEAEAGARAPKSELYSSYKEWAEVNGHRPLAQSRLIRRLGERGYKLDAGRRNVTGLAIIPLGRQL